jgi:hypothetical protein
MIAVRPCEPLCVAALGLGCICGALDDCAQCAGQIVVEVLNQSPLVRCQFYFS